MEDTHPTPSVVIQFCLLIQKRSNFIAGAELAVFIQPTGKEVVHRSLLDGLLLLIRLPGLFSHCINSAQYWSDLTLFSDRGKEYFKRFRQSLY